MILPLLATLYAISSDPDAALSLLPQQQRDAVKIVSAAVCYNKVTGRQADSFIDEVLVPESHKRNVSDSYYSRLDNDIYVELYWRFKGCPNDPRQLLN
ncbi:hypothetical protein VZG28_04915 [Synechococcus elongatus IITB4]|uniref:hypothetical protein n=1 Tax=Synechococcus elongatus TaxID=32046 RepID=UPI0030D4CBCF